MYMYMYMYSMYDQLIRRVELIPCAGCGFISNSVVPECVYMYVMYEAIIEQIYCAVIV